MQTGDLSLSHKKFLAKPIYRFAYRCLDNVKMYKYAIFDLNIMLFKRYEHFTKKNLTGQNDDRQILTTILPTRVTGQN